MANFSYIDATDATKFLKAVGEGTDGDPQIVEHKDTAAIQALGDINTKLGDIKTYTDGLEALTTATNTSLTAIAGFADQLETYTDGLETGISAIAANQISFGITTDVPATSNNGNFSFLALFKWLLGKIPQLTLAGDRLKIDAIFPEIQAVSGSISVTNFPATQPVSGNISIANFPATQAVGFATDAENTALTKNPLYTGGKAVNAATYTPNYTVGNAVGLAFDIASGGALTHNRKLTIADDAIQVAPNYESSDTPLPITSSSTAYIRGSAIDLRGYRQISILPNVTTAGGATGFYKISWSFDGTNWWDETVETQGAAAGGEIPVTATTLIRQFASDSTGFKIASAATFQKRARYFSISQKSDSAASLTAAYNYQRS